MKHQRIIEIAKAMKPLDWGKNPFHLTFAFRKNKLLAIGQNKPSKTHPRNLKYDYRDRNGRPRRYIVGIHSELAAVIKLGMTNCSDITFFVLRIDNRNKPNYSKPCLGCLDMFEKIGYSEVYYTDNKGKFKKMRLNEAK